MKEKGCGIECRSPLFLDLLGFGAEPQEFFVGEDALDDANHHEVGDEGAAAGTDKG